MRRLPKHGREWVYIVSPLGCDPYDNHGTSYMANTRLYELRKLRTNIVDEWVANQARREALIAVAASEKPTLVPFDGNPLL